MSEERRKVLEMLKEGKITPEEAEKLLDRLAASDSHASNAASINGTEVRVAPAATGTDATDDEGRPRKLRFLRVVVDSPKHDNVNIRVPLGLVRTGLKLSTLMPGRVNKRLSEKGIDLSHLGKLDNEELLTALGELHIDVEGEKGEKVRVFCE